MAYKNSIEDNDERYGKTKIYLEGQVVVWRGYNPAILRIPEDFVLNSFRQNSRTSISFNSIYNSCHYSNIRLATEKEIELLGDKEFIEYPI